MQNEADVLIVRTLNGVAEGLGGVLLEDGVDDLLLLLLLHLQLVLVLVSGCLLRLLVFEWGILPIWNLLVKQRLQFDCT